MTDKFQHKYRIPSTRLSHWDYGSNAMYFVTICTKNRECYFGDVAPSSPANPRRMNTTKMQLSEIGLLAQKYWLEIPIHFPFVVLDEFVVMPDHVHGILVMDKTDTNAVGGALDGVETPKLGVSTADPPSPDNSHHTAPRRTAAASQKWHPGTLGVIINQYKRMVTIRARKIHAEFGWQSRFHDHIIRNDASLQQIRKYIQDNPTYWKGE